MVKWKLSDSSYQSGLEGKLIERFELKHQMEGLRNQKSLPLKSAPGTTIKPDLYSSKYNLIGEVHTHIGPLKAAQQKKVATDVFKMVFFEADQGVKLIKYLIVCSKEEYDFLTSGKSYIAAAIKHYKVHVEYIELEDSETEKLKTVMSRQDLFRSNHMQGEDYSYIETMKAYLQDRNVLYDSYSLPAVYARRAGKKFSFAEHLKAMIYAFLSNQTKWIRIEPHLSEIDELFMDYDYERILSKPAEHFYKGLFALKCGNVATAKQMNELAYNIELLLSIEKEYGTLDAFVVSSEPSVIVKKLSSSSSRYKIKNLGEALAWEYLRNVGVDGMKPDVHLTRFLGSDRMGSKDNHIPATSDEAIRQIDRMSEVTGLTRCEIDNIIWSFGADSYGAICNAHPRCDLCPIKMHCNHIS